MKPLRLDELTLEQKIGQVLIARGLHDEEDFQFALDLIRHHALGGVQCPVWRDGFDRTMPAVLEAADYPLFVAADMEWGYPFGDLTMAGNMALGALDDPEAVYHFATVTAIQAKNAGFNMIWSPVVDAADFDRPNVITRCLNADPSRIGRLSTAYMRAFSDCGVIGSAKHFPSGDDNAVDSHMTESLCNKTKQELLDGNLKPYLEMMAALGEDMAGIMVGHTRCPKIDPDYPASLSKACIDIIREAGFDGLVITDSLAMTGIIQEFGDVRTLGLAMAAGNDLLLPNFRISFRDSYRYLLQAYRDGMFSEGRLNEAVSRVLKAQERTLRRPPRTTITEEDRQFVRRIDRDCICALTAPGVSPALDTQKRHLFAIDTENIYLDGDGNVSLEIKNAAWWDPQGIADRLKQEFPQSDVLFFSEFPSWEQNQNICYAATSHDDVVFVTFTQGNCYEGTDGLTERVRKLMESMQKKIAAVVHFGNPYALEKIVPVPRMLFGFMGKECVQYGLDVLCGKYPAKGKLPITLKR